MGWFRAFRLVVLTSASLLSLPPLVVSAVRLSPNTPTQTTYINLVVSLVVLLTLPIIIFLDFFRKGRYALLVIMELLLLTLLSILCFVGASLALALPSGHAVLCKAGQTRCYQGEMVYGFTVASGAILAAYTLTVVAKCIIVGHTGSLDDRPQRIWTARADDDFVRPDPCPMSRNPLRVSYGSGTLDIFAVKHDDDPFRRAPSITSIHGRQSMMQEQSLPASAHELLYPFTSPSLPSPAPSATHITDPSTPIYPVPV